MAKYSVNWSDPSYPEIVIDPDGTSFSEAKGQIVNHFSWMRDHAKVMIANTRALRVADTRDN